jgi:hypothetical protein
MVGDSGRRVNRFFAGGVVLYSRSEVAPNFSTGTTKDQIAAGQRAHTMSS